MRAVLVSLLAAAMVVPADAAASGLDQLKAFVEGAKSGRATFSQVTTSKSARVPQEASGTFVFARPGKFRWTYDKPHEQLIVGDGAKVWIYDRDLNQVIVRKLDRALGSTPAALLAGDNVLDRAFELAEGGTSAGLEWVDAKPRSAEAGFERVRIGFKDNLPRAMELMDSFGQTTKLAFGAVERNPVVAADLFRFVTPKGADVIGALD